MPDSTEFQPPEHGTPEWYEFMDRDVTYDELDLSFENARDEPTVEFRGTSDGRATTTDRVQVVFHQPSPRVDGTGHPIREITGQLTNSGGAGQEVRLFLTGWDPQNPDATAVYASRPLSATAQAHTDVVDVGDGESLGVTVSTASAQLDQIYEDAHELEMWRLEQRLVTAGQVLADAIRAYRAATDGIDDPGVEHNLRVLTEGLRTAQKGLDHLHDPAATPTAQIYRAKYYIRHLPLERHQVEQLVSGERITSAFNEYDPRLIFKLRPSNDSILRAYQQDRTYLNTFENLEKDAETWGEFHQSEAIGRASNRLAGDLIVGTYDAAVGETIWGWAFPLLDLAITGEGRNHMGERQTAGQWAALGLSLGLNAASKARSVLEISGRAGGVAETASDLGTTLQGDLLDKAAGQAKDYVVSDHVAPALEQTVDHAVRAAGLAAGGEAPAASPPAAPVPSPPSPSDDAQIDAGAGVEQPPTFEWSPPEVERGAVAVPDEPAVPRREPTTAVWVIEDESEPPWLEELGFDPDPDPYLETSGGPTDRQGQSGGRRRAPRDQENHYTADGEDPPDKVLAAKRSIEHTLGLHLGINLIGSSELISWTDPIGPLREAYGVKVRFRLNEALRPQRLDEFQADRTAAFLMVVVSPEDPFERGALDRVFTSWMFVVDRLDHRVKGAARTKWDKSPVGAVRKTARALYSKGLSRALRASDDRAPGEIPYEVMPVADQVPVKIPVGFVPPFGAFFRTKYGVVAGLALIALLVGVILLAARSDGSGAPASSAAAPTADGQTTPESEPDTSEVGTPPEVPPADDLPLPIAIERLGGPEDEDAPYLVVVEDPDGGISWSVVDSEGQALPSSEIEETWLVEVLWTLDELDPSFNRSSFPCGGVTADYRVTCPLGAGLLAEGEYLVIGVELAGPIGEGARTFTYGLAFDDGDESDNYQFQPPFTADFFRNTEFWYRLHIGEDGTRTMWADAARDGALGYPRYSGAAAIEFGSTLVWVIPRSELPEGELGYRVTAFHNNGEPDAIPSPLSSGGDVSGLGVEEPLIPIEGEPVAFDNIDGLPSDIEDPIARVEVVDPESHIASVLVTEAEERINAALAAGDSEALWATLHPGARGGDDPTDCRAGVDGSLALADSVSFGDDVNPPDTSSGFPIYQLLAEINYPTGTVAWGPILTPGPLGRLYLILPSCF